MATSSRTLGRRKQALAVSIFLAGLLFVLVTVNGFLAVTSPYRKGVLVVEGWIPQSALLEAATEFHRGSYTHFVMVGGDAALEYDQEMTNRRTPITPGEAAELGVAPSQLVVIPVVVERERTITQALAVRRWMEGASLFCTPMDVFTLGVHARKSWIMFRNAMGAQCPVGIIAGTEPSYNATWWMFSRRGVWVVSRNLIGYAYSKAIVFVR